MVALLALIVLGLVVIFSSGGDSSKPTPSHGAATRRKPAPASASGAAPAIQVRADRTIDGVLRYTPFVTSGAGHRRVVALTFDDGPSPYTQAIMGTLRRTHTPATFFIVGQQLNSFASVLRDEFRQGFEVGDHTENHKWLPRLPPAAQYGQINDDALRIRKIGGAYPRLFRPPYGAVAPSTFHVLHGVRMLTVLWSIDPGDWRRPGTGTIVSSVLARARPGAIVILHDGGGYRDQTVAALPAIIDGLHKRHFTLVSVSQLLRDDPPSHHQKLPGLGGQ